MKIITSLIGIAGLSLATLAVAQEQQTVSPAPEEKPSTTVEQATTPSSETTTTAKAPEQTSAQQKEKPGGPSASPRPPVTPKPPSSPAATPLKNTSVEATLKDNENKWEASYAAHNTSVAQSLVANDFAGVYWDGRVMNKSAVIAEMKKDRDTYKSAVNEKLAVYTHGPSVAVVIGTTHEKGTTKDGKPFDRMFRFTDTWVKRGSQWQCVASHVMKLRG